MSRIRDAIKEGRESTEVFLNYRQDSTPFWNLLLVGILTLDTLTDDSAAQERRWRDYTFLWRAGRRFISISQTQ